MDISNVVRTAILNEIMEERERQISIAHGGDTESFDKTNRMNDWVGYVCAYAGRAAAKVARNQKEDVETGVSRDDKQRFRDNMVKVAALALAAIESHDAGCC